MTHKQHFNFYIASCCADGGILFCEFREGGATVIEKTVLDRPMYMVKEGRKMHVLLRDPENKNESGVITFGVENGLLKEAEQVVSTKGSVACHICTLRENVYCVNYLSGNVVKLPGNVVTHKGHGINPKRQEMPHTHYINSFDGTHLLCTDLGTDQIYTYDEDLNEISKVSVPSGHGPRHLEFLDDKVYCLNELMSTVSVFDYKDGVLALRDTVCVLPEENNTESFAAAIRTDGRYIYVSNRGHDSISVLVPDGETVKLIKTIGCGGKSPRDFNIFGNILICANELSDNVTFFELKDGIPEKLDFEVNVKSPLCVI